jgi:hypothetical protein
VAPWVPAAGGGDPRQELTRHRHRRWRIVTGANLPAAERAQLDKLAAGDPDIAIEGFRGDFAWLLATCHLSVSQGGYNTVMELDRDPLPLGGGAVRGRRWARASRPCARACWWNARS